MTEMISYIILCDDIMSISLGGPFFIKVQVYISCFVGMYMYLSWLMVTLQ